MKAIEIQNLTKSYGKARGIIDVSISVNEGDIIGFIGPNGAGKSTTIRTLLGLLEKNSGEAKIFGVDVRTNAKILNDVGYLPAEVAYYDQMKVIDLLKYSASFYMKDCQKRMAELLTLFDLNPQAKIDDLSFGNKKKLGIIQGLMHEPKLLILDEPTSGLDPIMQQTFFKLLKEENQKGVTIFFSSHILSEVEKICQSVIIIKEGIIVAKENIASLKQKSHSQVEIELADLNDVDKIKLEGMINVTKDNHTLNFLYAGNINSLIKKLALISISKISIKEPDLEEVFYHYYKAEE